MEENLKVLYEPPVARVIDISAEGCILQASLDKSWEIEDL